jgi:hypothetical protein
MKKFVLLSLIGIFFIILSFTTVMSTQITLKEGEEQKITIGGTDYTIRLEGVSSETLIVVSVNGVAKACNKDSIYKISGLNVKVVDIFYYPTQTTLSSALLDVSQSVTQENKTCVDSDGGLNYYVKGTVTVCTFTEQGGGCGAAIDSCNGNILTEGYCKGTDLNSLTYTCPYGCKDGACIPTTTTTIPVSCVNHNECSQACDYLGTEKWQYSRKWQGICPQGVYGCMTGDCCLGQCSDKVGCFCQHTNVVDMYGNVCSAGKTCGQDCYCHCPSGYVYDWTAPGFPTAGQIQTCIKREVNVPCSYLTSNLCNRATYLSIPANTNLSAYADNMLWILDMGNIGSNKYYSWRLLNNGAIVRETFSTSVGFVTKIVQDSNNIAFVATSGTGSTVDVIVESASSTTYPVISCPQSTCSVNNCQCTISGCGDGFISFYSTTDCTGIPTNNLAFSNSYFNWKPANVGKYYVYVLCNNQYKSDCTAIEVFPATTTTIPSTTCSDSDGGLDYYTKGCIKVCYSDIGGTCATTCDFCISDGKGSLNERYCGSNNEAIQVVYSCPYGCLDGACIQEPVTTVPNNGISLVDVYCKDLTIVATIRNDGRDKIDTSSLKFYVNGILDSSPNCDKDVVGLNPGETTVCNKLEGVRSYNSLLIVGPSNSVRGSVYCGMETTTTIPELNVQITSPRDGQTVSGKVTVIVNANGYNQLGDMTLSIQKEGDTTAMLIPLTSCGGGLTCPTIVGGRCQYTKSCTYDWDTSSFKDGVLLTAIISDVTGQKATATSRVYVKSSSNLIIKILSPSNGQKVSGKVTVEASAESQYQLGDMSLSIEKRQVTDTGGSGGGVIVNFTECYPVGICNSVGCFYHVNCRYIWDTENYDGEVFLTASITDKMNNKGTNSVNVYVSNYQTCSDQCESMGYKYDSCKTGCDADEINIGSNGCPQVACAPCVSGQPCPLCPVYSCCCSKKLSCPYECCANDPNYQDKPCPTTTCPTCEPGKECPSCIQPKCVDHSCVWYPQEEFLLEFKEGWNVFSFPVDIRSYQTAVSQPVQQITIQKTITGQAVEVEPIPPEKQCTSPNHVWHYSNGKYIDVLNDPNGFVNGWGYWVKMDSDCTVRLKGNKITINDFPELEPGWNQIGSPSEAVNFFSVIGSCNVLSGPWWFNSDSKKYEKTQVLRPGEGYFIKVKDKCKLGSEIPPLPPEELSIISKALKIK